MKNITVFLALLVFAACETVAKVGDSMRDATPRERYVEALQTAGLADAALARDWVASGALALEDPSEVALPFREETFITPERPRAVAYRVSLARGRKLTISVTASESVRGELARVFVELFRVPADTADPHRPQAGTDSVPWFFEYEPWRAGEFVVRVQPELLRGGRFTIELGHQPQLVFPVAGRSIGSVLSFFGDERDGGRRVHHGVDIFAPRGTPVLAGSAGETYRVSETPIGGKIVWIRDTVRQAAVYYAHLDSQTVGNGEWVEAGDTLGFVGNTGNARTTPPHLHFGLYRRGRRGDPDRGPVDPLPFLRTPRGSLATERATPGLLGQWVRIQSTATLRATPSGRALAPFATPVRARVLAAAAEGERVAYLVELHDGGTGYVGPELLEAGNPEAYRDRVAAEGGAAGLRSEEGRRRPKLPE